MVTTNYAGDPVVTLKPENQQNFLNLRYNRKSDRIDFQKDETWTICLYANDKMIDDAIAFFTICKNIREQNKRKDKKIPNSLYGSLPDLSSFQREI